mmetsp:Transcript_58735/g.108378  ORF Transcript_58735/g.108378 Transcript_58735/m.108378 type:complete len:248 (-) Transcript_58735:138-881(-)
MEGATEECQGGSAGKSIRPLVATIDHNRSQTDQVRRRRQDDVPRRRGRRKALGKASLTGESIRHRSGDQGRRLHLCLSSTGQTIVAGLTSLLGHSSHQSTLRHGTDLHPGRKARGQALQGAAVFTEPLHTRSHMHRRCRCLAFTGILLMGIHCIRACSQACPICHSKGSRHMVCLQRSQVSPRRCLITTDRRTYMLLHRQSCLHHPGFSQVANIACHRVCQPCLLCPRCQCRLRLLLPAAPFLLLLR